MILIAALLINYAAGFNQQPKCPEESAKNIASGSLTVVSNGGWTIGGWGFASPFNARNFGGPQYNWGSGNFGYGNFGDNNQGNGNFGSSNLGDANLGSWNVGRDNCGNYNVGAGNVGNWNVGRGNVGSYNLGSANSGTGNTGQSNSGQLNIGLANNGANNIGIENSGSFNYGIENSGIQNYGWSNTGNWNSGTGNAGNGNAGASNTGNFNIGFLNEGNNNTGAWNYGTGNVGYLAGVQAVTLTGIQSNLLPWTGVTINTVNSQQGTSTTGWANINSTNVGIGQSGYRNLGYDNVGGYNIGYENSGQANTGFELIGEFLVGSGQTNGPGSNFQPVTINGVADETELLLTRVTGLVQDFIVTPYPSVFANAINSQLSNPTSVSDCPTFAPVEMVNSFSVSVRCRGGVKITDLYCSGDSFEVYKDGKLWLTTPVVPMGSCQQPVVDPDEAFYDPEFSHIMAWLPAGSFKLTVRAKVTAWGGGAIAVKVDDFCDRTGIGNYIPF